MGRFLAQVFGRISFQAPPWLRWIIQWLNQSALVGWMRRQREWAKKNPAKARRRKLIATASLAGVAALGYWGWNYYLSLPKPHFVEVSIYPPSEPDLETGEPKNLVIKFSESAARLEQAGLVVEKGIELSPEVQGQWLWRDDRTLLFKPSGAGTPKGVWQIDRKYKIQFDKKLFPKHVRLETLNYDFSTPPLRGRLANQEFFQDPVEAKIKRVIFKFYFNYEVNVEDFKKRATLSLRSKEASVLGKGGKSFPFAVSAGKFNNELYVTSEPVGIPPTDSIMEVKVAKGVRGANGGEMNDEVSAAVEVPGLMTYFRFVSARLDFVRNARFEPEQILLLETKADAASEVIAKNLEVHLLPEKNPDEPLNPKRKKASRFFRWTSASQLTANVRSKLEPVTLTTVPTEHEAAKLHSFRLDVPTGRYLYLKVAKGLKSFGGYELAQDYETVIHVEDFPRELSIMSQGSILSYSGERKIPLLSRNVSEVTFEIARILPEQLNQMVVNVYRGWMDFSRPEFSYFNIDTLAEKFEEKRKLQVLSPRETNYFHFDLDSYLQKNPARKGVFHFQVSDKDGNHQDRRLIMVTDLGLVAKENAYGGNDVFVQNIRSGAAIAGAQIEVLGTNGLTIFSTRTGADGQASLPDLSAFKNEKTPIAIVARSNQDFSFLPFRMSERELNLSRFDVGGVVESKDTEQLVAYVFSDRGIYRPGESANFGLIVRSRNPSHRFQDVPLFWSVIDARGNEIHRERIRVKSADMTDLRFATDESAPTGRYEVRVYLTKPNESNQLIGSTSVRVEEFIPDRMKISAVIAGQKVTGWTTPKDLKGVVTLRNLFGTPAENRRVDASMTLAPAQPYFPAYKDYRFIAFRHKESTLSETLSSVETDTKGEAEFPLDLTKFGAAMYWLRFEAEGFEAGGGRSVRSATQTLVSPLPYLVGFKSDGDLNYLKTNSVHKIDMIAINSDLKRQSVKAMKGVLVEKAYVSALMKDPAGVYRYQSVLKEKEVKNFSLEIPEQGVAWDVPTATPGDFELVLKNGADQEVQRIGFSVIGEANLARSLDRTSELQLILNQRDYEPRGTIEMQIKAPYTGSGLITIERDRVYAHKWFSTETTSSVQRIDLPAGLEGNAYVSVTFLRDSRSKEIFTKPLSYAVQPFSISLASRRVQLKLEGPERVRPGEKLEIRYSSDKPAKIVLYGVDEGILQFAQYKLPDPLEFFFRRRALQVKTYQLLDLMMPEYALLRNETATGGDAAGALGRNLNPFKRKGEPPVVFWSNVLNVGSDVKTFAYPVPESFNGNLRVMAVAASETSFGAGSTDVLVRGDYILSPNVPLFVAGSDELEVTVGVSNQEVGSGAKAKVKVKAETDARLVGSGYQEQELEIAEGREGLAKFRFKAQPSFGDAAIKFTAQGVKASARITSHLSVRPAIPYQSLTLSGFVEDDKFTVPIERRLLPDFRDQEAGLSTWPLVLGRGFRIYLDNYPYVCTEQLVSKGIPYLTLGSYPEFKISAADSRKFFDDAIRMLRARQTDTGGFALYAGGPADIWPTLHAIQYLIEAKGKGLPVPPDLLRKAVQSLPVKSGARYDGSSALFTTAYSLYLQARDGTVQTEAMKLLRLSVSKMAPKFYSESLGGAYVAATLKLYKLDSEANSVLSQFLDGKVSRVSHGLFDPLSEYGATLALIARHFPERIKEIANPEVMKLMLKPLQRGLFNTYSSAHLLYGFDALAQMEKASQPGNAGKSIAEISADGRRLALTLSQGLASSAKFSDNAQKLEFISPEKMPYFYFVTQSGFDREMPKEAIAKNLEISREYLGGDGKAIATVNLGDEVQVRLRVRATVKDLMANVAIVDLLPGGFEPVIDSMEAEQRSDLRTEDEPEGEDELEFDGDEGAQFNPLRWLLPKAWAQAVAGMAALDVDFMDRREDRVVLYARVTKSGGEYVYRAKAVARGQFVVPPAFAQSMYDPEVVARGLPGRIVVE